MWGSKGSLGCQSLPFYLPSPCGGTLSSQTFMLPCLTPTWSLKIGVLVLSGMYFYPVSYCQPFERDLLQKIYCAMLFERCMTLDWIFKWSRLWSVRGKLRQKNIRVHPKMSNDIRKHEKNTNTLANHLSMKSTWTLWMLSSLWLRADTAWVVYNEDTHSPLIIMCSRLHHNERLIKIGGLGIFVKKQVAVGCGLFLRPPSYSIDELVWLVWGQTTTALWYNLTSVTVLLSEDFIFIDQDWFCYPRFFALLCEA